MILVSVLWCVNCYYVEEEREPIYLTVHVGHYALLNCNVDFPQDMAIPYLIKWKKDVSFSVNNCLTFLLGSSLMIILKKMIFNSTIKELTIIPFFRGLENQIVE